MLYTTITIEGIAKKENGGIINLTPAIRIELALQLEPLIQKKAKENQGSRNDLLQKGFDDFPQKSSESETREQIAKIAGVSHDTVSKYKKVKEKATPELLEQVKSVRGLIDERYQTYDGCIH